MQSVFILSTIMWNNNALESVQNKKYKIYYRWIHEFANGNAAISTKATRELVVKITVITPADTAFHSLVSLSHTGISLQFSMQIKTISCCGKIKVVISKYQADSSSTESCGLLWRSGHLFTSSYNSFHNSICSSQHLCP